MWQELKDCSAPAAASFRQRSWRFRSAGRKFWSALGGVESLACPEALVHPGALDEMLKFVGASGTEGVLRFWCRCGLGLEVEVGEIVRDRDGLDVTPGRPLLRFRGAETDLDRVRPGGPDHGRLMATLRKLVPAHFSLTAADIEFSQQENL